MKEVVFFAVAFLTSTLVRAEGPFGVTMGTPIASYPTCVKVADQPGFYKCASVPKPHPAFEAYVLQAFPETGVCYIKAIGKNISDGGSGVQTKLAMAELSGQITAKYGTAPKLYDFNNSGTFDEPQYWVLSLKEKSRTYGDMWTFAPPTETGVATITLSAVALDTSTTFIAAEFEFSNNTRCDKIVKAKGADAF